jgi:hypothetical protein
MLLFDLYRFSFIANLLAHLLLPSLFHPIRFHYPLSAHIIDQSINTSQNHSTFNLTFASTSFVRESAQYFLSLIHFTSSMKTINQTYLYQ